MSLCPWCSNPVPFGGGTTVKNAHLMFLLVQTLSPLAAEADVGAPEWEVTDAMEFLYMGEHLANSLHEYGHKRTMVNPDWKASGEWTRIAKELVNTLTRT